MSNKILFVTHAANRSGAPLALLHLIHWIRKNTNYQIDILLQSQGPLENEFIETSKNHFYYDKLPPAFRYFRHIVGRDMILKLNRKFLKFQLQRQKYDLIYANSLACDSILRKLKLNSPMITQIREMKYVFDAFSISPSSYLMKNTKLFIAINNAVAQNLKDNFDIDPYKINVISTYTNINNSKKSSNHNNDCIVGSAGTVEWRKGADLFVQLAKIFTSTYPDTNCKFVWVGRFENDFVELQIKHDVRMLGLESVVQFVGESEKPIDYFKNFDVFALMSREEPLGLVCIENIQLGVPVICFDHVGGMVEYADKGAAIKVPYLDLIKMSISIHSLLSDQHLVQNITKKAHQEIMSIFDIDKIGKKTVQVINKVIEH